jgi:hypothetical protein
LNKTVVTQGRTGTTPLQPEQWQAAQCRPIAITDVIMTQAVFASGYWHKAARFQRHAEHDFPTQCKPSTIDGWAHTNMRCFKQQ